MTNENKPMNEEFEEIKKLVYNALDARNKKEAEPFIKRLEFISQSAYSKPDVGNILGELISYTKTASGQVKQKEHWISAVQESLDKLQFFSCT